LYAGANRSSSLSAGSCQPFRSENNPLCLQGGIPTISRPFGRLCESALKRRRRRRGGIWHGPSSGVTG
jgi:hypothetical protein